MSPHCTARAFWFLFNRLSGSYNHSFFVLDRRVENIKSPRDSALHCSICRGKFLCTLAGVDAEFRPRHSTVASGHRRLVENRQLTRIGTDEKQPDPAWSAFGRTLQWPTFHQYKDILIEEQYYFPCLPIAAISFYQWDQSPAIFFQSQQHKCPSRHVWSLKIGFSLFHSIFVIC